MAQCQETAQEFIQNVFSPMVAVLCSSDVKNVCDKNNLTFVELIQPFCQLSTEVQIRDTNNVAHTIRGLRVIVRDMNAGPPLMTHARKLLNDAVTNVLPAQNTDIMPKNVTTVGNHDLQLDATTPWYEAYRTAFFQIAYPSDHEFLFHYLACIFVVSTSAADPMDQFSQLTQRQHQQQHQQQHRLPRWFSPNILHYYVLVHDVIEHEEAKAETVFQNMKTKYGVLSCHLLHINSKAPSGDPRATTATEAEHLPDPWIRLVSSRREATFEEDMSCSNCVEVADSNHSSGGFGLGGMDQAIEAVEGVTMPTAGSETSLPSLATGTVIYDPLGSNLPPVDSTSSLASTNHVTASSRLEATESSARSGVHGAALTLSDHDRLRIFMHEFIVRGLITWAEKTMRSLSEQAATRKGIHRSFFSATKKWFGGGKQAAQVVVTNNTNVVYMPEAPEMQTRRLADLAFMFQMYDTAYQIYHTAKRDFNNDHALLHYAGAMEMACLAIFMQGSASQRQYPQHYMEATITTYLAIKMPQHLATRATLLSSEILKSKGLYAEAAMQFIRMTSEESDLRSALLLEQAAHCFIKMKSPMIRKYAFHMVLAGHRFIKAGQKQHALRSYAQALQIFKGRDWTLAEDHINFTIGIQSFSLKQLNIATSAFKHLLTADSKQSAYQQTAFLKEYFCVFKQCAQKLEEGGGRKELPQLPLPSVEIGSIKVLCGNTHTNVSATMQTGSRVLATGVTFDSTQEENIRFAKLEEKLIGSLSSNQMFRPTIECYTSATNNSASPLVVIGEPLTVQLELHNPIKVGLMLRDIVLLWKFVPKPGKDQSGGPTSSGCPSTAIEMEFGKTCNEIGRGIVQFESIPQLLLEGMERKQLRICLSVRSKGHLQITGLAFNLSCVTTPQQSITTNSGQTPLSSGECIADNHDLLVDDVLAPVEVLTNHVVPGVMHLSMAGRIDLEVQGPRLNISKEERMGRYYGVDKRLNPFIVGKMPKLQVYFCNFPTSLFCGEVQRVSIELTNVGSSALTNVRIITSDTQYFNHNTNTSQPDVAYPLSTDNKACFVTDIKSVGPVTENLLNSAQLEGGGNVLEAGATCTVCAWVRAPDSAGEHCVDFLLCYEPVKKKTLPDIRYRLVRHTVRFTTHSSLSIRAACHRIICDPAPTETSNLNCLTAPMQQSCDTPQHCLNNSVVAALEIENATKSVSCVSSKFSIVQVSCVSPEWKLIPRVKQSIPESSISNQECLQLTLHASHVHQPSNDKKITNISSTSLDSKLIDVAGSVCSDFYFRSGSTVDVTDQGNGSSASGGQLDRALDMQHRLDQCHTVNLSFIVIWKASICDGSGLISVITGQHHITLNRLNTVVSAPPALKTPLEQAPINFRALTSNREVVVSTTQSVLIEPSAEVSSQLVIHHIRHPVSVNHDFRKQRLCRVNVDLCLLNTTGVELCVDIDVRSSYNRSLLSTGRRPLSPINSSLFDDRPSQCFTWAGLRVIRLRFLPHASQSQRLTACFSAPGLYDLTSLQVLAKPVEQQQQTSSSTVVATPGFVQRSIFPAFITISASSVQ